MSLTHDMVFVGPALSCANSADEVLSKRVPEDLNFYIHEYRKALEVPYFFFELQPERRWVEFIDGKFVPKNNKWWFHYGTNKHFLYELSCQPHIIGVHCPIAMIDVLDSSYNLFKKLQSIASMRESMEYANAVGADYWVYHLIQKDDWLSLGDRMGRMAEESYKIFILLTEYYRKRNFKFQICIEILEFPKYPATPYESEDMLHVCQLRFPGTKLVFDVSHLWRSQAIIAENRFTGFENVYKPPFINIMADTLNRMGSDDVPIFHLGGCWEIGTHGVPGIYPWEDPYEAEYRLDHPSHFYREDKELNYSLALDLIIDFCWKHNQPLKLILEIHERNYFAVLRSCKEVKNAIHRKLERRWRA